MASGKVKWHDTLCARNRRTDALHYLKCACPQLSQKFASSLFSVPQDGQNMVMFLNSSVVYWTKYVRVYLWVIVSNDMEAVDRWLVRFLER